MASSKSRATGMSIGNGFRLAIVLAVSVTVISCGRPADLDTVAATVEESARSLKAGDGVESEVEIRYGIEGPWTLVALPPGEIDRQALARAGIEAPLLQQLEGMAGPSSRGQFLIQTRPEGLLARPLTAEVLNVPKQLIVSGQNTQWVVAKLRLNAQAAKAELVDLTVRQR